MNAELAREFRAIAADWLLSLPALAMVALLVILFLARRLIRRWRKGWKDHERLRAEARSMETKPEESLGPLGPGPG